MKHHTIRGVLALLISFASGAYAAEPIVFGTTQALSGAYKEFGTEQLHGIQMWVDDVNARGALLGRPVKLIHYDDASLNRVSVEGFTKLAEQDKADFFIGPYSSALTVESSNVAERYGIPMVATSASSEHIWNRGLSNIFGIDTPANSYIDGVHLLADPSNKTVALVYADTEFTAELAAGVRRRAQTAGFRFVLDESFPPAERNFESLANRLANIDADIVIGATYLEDSVAMVRALKTAKVKPEMLVFTGGSSLQEFGTLLGKDAESIVGVTQWLPTVRMPGAQDFAYRYRKRYGIDPSVPAIIGYSAGQILETAIRLAGTTDREAVREQLRSMYFRSLLGRYQVDSTGRQVAMKNYVLQWQDNQRRLVLPANLAERELIYPMP